MNETGALVILAAALTLAAVFGVIVWLDHRRPRCPVCNARTELYDDYCGPCTAAIARGKTRAMQAFRDHWRREE